MPARARRAARKLVDSPGSRASTRAFELVDALGDRVGARAARLRAAAVMLELLSESRRARSLIRIVGPTWNIEDWHW
jgi:hypothetical protein